MYFTEHTSWNHQFSRIGNLREKKDFMFISYSLFLEIYNRYQYRYKLRTTLKDVSLQQSPLWCVTDILFLKICNHHHNARSTERGTLVKTHYLGMFQPLAKPALSTCIFIVRSHRRVALLLLTHD